MAIAHANGLDSAGAVAPWFTCARWTPATPVSGRDNWRRDRLVQVGTGDACATGRAVAGRAGHLVTSSFPLRWSAGLVEAAV